MNLIFPSSCVKGNVVRVAFFFSYSMYWSLVDPPNLRQKIDPMEHDGSCLLTRVVFQTFQQMIRLSPNIILSAKMDFKGEECFSLLLRAQKLEKHQDKFGHSSHSSRLFNTSGLGSLLNLTRPFTGHAPSFLWVGPWTMIHVSPDHNDGHTTVGVSPNWCFFAHCTSDSNEDHEQ